MVAGKHIDVFGLSSFEGGVDFGIDFSCKLNQKQLIWNRCGDVVQRHLVCNVTTEQASPKKNIIQLLYCLQYTKTIQ